MSMFWWWDVREWRFGIYGPWPWEELARVKTLYRWSAQLGPVEIRRAAADGTEGK